MYLPSLVPPSLPRPLSHYKPLFLYPSLCSPSVNSPASHATIIQPGQGDEAANLAAPPSRSTKSLTQGNHAKINYKVRTPPRESRRTLLWKCVGLGLVVFHVNPSSSLQVVEVKGPVVIRYQKLKFGVKIEEIVEGQGPEAHEGDLVEINYVCRRSNGYFVHSTVDQLSGESKPVILPLDEKEVIQGLKDVLVGMKVGGKRRALIPPSLGYVNEGLKPIPDEFGPRRSLLSHAKEPLVFEIQLLRLL